MSNTVADYLLKRLGEWSVERIDGYPGDGINGIIGALERAEGKPRFIQARPKRWRPLWPVRMRSSPAKLACAWQLRAWARFIF